MIKLIKLFLLVAVCAVLLAGPPTAKAFNFFGSVCKNDTVQNSPAQTSPTCQQATNESGNNNRVTGTKSIINAAVNILALATGIAAVIIIIIGGFTMVTSAGNQEAVAASRRRITAAVVGLLIVALSWTIIRFISDKLIK